MSPWLDGCVSLCLNMQDPPHCTVDSLVHQGKWLSVFTAPDPLNF